MSKYTLILNSHSLSNFQACEYRHLYNDLLSLEPAQSKKVMDRGTLMAKYLEVYYHQQLKPRRYKELYLLNSLKWLERLTKKLEISTSEARNILMTLREYGKFYKNETWRPISVETGFSKILYEDTENLFIYEGRPDFYGWNDLGNGQSYKFVADHKTQTQRRPYYEFNNQTKGYLWALDVTEFCYNYLVIKTQPEYYRQSIKFEPEQITAWQSETIEWYFRIKSSLQRKSFIRTWQCESKFGLCPFHFICERPNEKQQLFAITSMYKKRKPYRSW